MSVSFYIAKLNLHQHEVEVEVERIPVHASSPARVPLTPPSPTRAPGSSDACVPTIHKYTNTHSVSMHKISPRSVPVHKIASTRRPLIAMHTGFMAYCVLTYTT